MRSLKVTTGPTTRGVIANQENLSWEQIVARLKNSRSNKKTLAEYRALTVDERNELKDGFGYMIGGYFRNSSKKKEDFIAKSVLTLDLDFVDVFELPDLAPTYVAYEYVLHSSMSHGSDRPKLRLMFPLARDVSEQEYMALARMVASWFNIEAVDRVSYKITQVMYGAAHCSDVTPVFARNSGDWLDPDVVLNTCYTDWKDPLEWPYAERDGLSSVSAVKAEDPGSKSGVFGEFCRMFSIPTAIERFGLPYAPTPHEDRWSYSLGTSSQGAVLYDSETLERCFLFSHHGSDKVYDRLVNAWDLVRIHKFGDSPESKLEMLEFVNSLPEFVELAIKQAGFEDLTNAPAEPGDDAQPSESLDPYSSVFPDLTAEDSDADSPHVDSTTAVKSGTPPKKGSEFTFDALATTIVELEPGCSKEQCDKVAQKIGIARLTSAETAVLADALRRKYPGKVGKTAMVETIKQLGKAARQARGSAEDDKDLERMLITEALREHFADGAHLRRMQHNYWVYREGLWRLEEDEVIDGKLTKTIIRIRETKPKTARQLVAFVGDNKTSSAAGALRAMFRHLQAAEHGDIDDPLGLRAENDLPVVNCKNCELHFDERGTMRVLKHNPENFHTVRIDTSYDAAATCPIWDRFVDHLFVGSLDPDEDRRHLEEFLGYVIQTSRFLRVWALFHGPTGTGKSTIADVLKALMGESVLERDVRVFEGGKDKFAELQLVGKLLAVDEDQAKGVLLPDGALKKLSEGKILSAERKFGGIVNFRNRALPLILSNHYPQTKDQSDALRDRALVFEFSNPYRKHERDDRVKARMIREELPGILNRLLAGIARLRARGRWDVPWSMQRALEKWLSKSSPVNSFITESLVVRPGTPASACLSAQKVWHRYLRWVPDSGRSVCLPRPELFERMEQLGYPVIDGHMRGVIDFKEDET